MWSDLKLEVCTDFERGTKRIVEVVVVVVGISGGGGDDGLYDDWGWSNKRQVSILNPKLFKDLSCSFHPY